MEKILLGILILSCTFAKAEIELTVNKDDFSNDSVTTLRVTSMEREPSTIFISCFPESGITVQLAFNGVIFPDDITDTGMIVAATHKFDNASDAYTTNWFLNVMKYENAWYQGDKSQFMNEAIKAGQLNIRLNRNGDIVRFDFKGAGEKLEVVRAACSGRSEPEPPSPNRTLIIRRTQ